MIMFVGGEYADSGVGSEPERESSRELTEDDSDNELNSPSVVHSLSPSSPVANGAYIVSTVFRLNTFLIILQ